MSTNYTLATLRLRPAARGYTLVELLVALGIGLFLLAGLVSILQGTRRTSSDQMELAQLQTNERLATTMMTDVIQQAGYYPDVQTSTLQSAFPAAPALASAPAFTQAGQFITGQTNATGNGDSITVRYQTDSTGTVLNCLGQNHDATSRPHAYTFAVSSSRQLVCSVDGNPPAPLVGNVQGLRVLYGVDAVSVSAYSSFAPNAYVPANEMTPVNWMNVRSVRIVITFTNPLAGQPGQGAAPAITLTRVVGIMARTGVNVVSTT